MQVCGKVFLILLDQIATSFNISSSGNGSYGLKSYYQVFTEVGGASSLVEFPKK